MLAYVNWRIFFVSISGGLSADDFAELPADAISSISSQHISSIPPDVLKVWLFATIRQLLIIWLFCHYFLVLIKAAALVYLYYHTDRSSGGGTLYLLLVTLCWTSFQVLSDNQIEALSESQAAMVTADQYNAFPTSKRTKLSQQGVPSDVTTGGGGGGGGNNGSGTKAVFFKLEYPIYHILS